jgi:hypothetical protein
MIQDEISSDINILNHLNKMYPWIPNENTIRPTQTDLVKKYFLNNTIQIEWRSMKDYILHTVFKKQFISDEHSKKFVPPNEHNVEWVFEPSMFRYNLIPEARHYILWNNKYDFSKDFNSFQINELIKIALHDRLSHDNFDFAWYKNPKPTIPEFYHIQVFWVDLYSFDVVNSI